MADPFNIIGAADAAAVLAEAKAIGQPVGFNPRNAGEVTIYVAQVIESLSEDDIRGQLRTVGVMDLEIPVQTNFAVMSTNARPVVPGDVFQWPMGSGRYFSVKAEPDIKQGSNGYVWYVKAYERKTLTLGAKS